VTVTLGQPLVPDPSVLARLSEEIAASGRWTNGGPVVERLETYLAEMLGWPQVSAAGSGTAALTLALLALDLPLGSEVVTTPLTFPATTAAIEAAGLRPVFAAVDPETLNLAPAAVEQAIGPRTSAVLPVHLFGIAVDREIDRIAAEHGLPVVYDAAHAFGFAPIAHRGTFAAYSLHATKLLHTGEGGLVATTDTERIEAVRRARNFGLAEDGRAVVRGINGKLPEMSAALGLAVAPRVDDEVQARERLRDAYSAAVAASDRVSPHAPGAPRGLVMEVVRCGVGELPTLEQDLRDNGIVSRSFPALCAPGSRFEAVPIVGGTARDVIRLASTVLALPFHGRVRAADVEKVAQVFGRPHRARMIG